MVVTKYVRMLFDYTDVETNVLTYRRSLITFITMYVFIVTIAFKASKYPNTY